MLLPFLLIALGHALLWFAISLLLRRNDVADIGWGVGGILLVWSSFFLGGNSLTPITALPLALVTFWGGRLALHITRRVMRTTEDRRYKAWREEWGKTVVLRSLGQIYLLQTALLVVITSPVWVSMLYGPPLHLPLIVAGSVLWILGAYFEIRGDRELAAFLTDPNRTERIMTRGLWAYTRHPNYFGEATMWWGIWIMTIPGLLHLPLIISPITLTCLLLFVSGVPMVEARYQDDPEYQAYQRRTSVFLPLPPRQN